MKHTLFKATSLVITLLLSACGGGGGGGSSSTNTSSSGTTITGTAATGAPMSGATVKLIDKNGNVVATTTADSNGAFSFTNINTTTNPPPYVLTAFGQIGDTQDLLISLKADGTTGSANITPITHAIAASISSTGDPLRLVNNTSSESGRITSNAINNADTAYRSALVNVASVAGYTSGSLINAPFSTAHDKLLDNVKIDLRPGGEISITSSGGIQSDDLGNSISTPTLPKSVTLTSGSLPTSSNASNLPAPTSLIGVTDLEVLRLAIQSCFAVPSTSRGTFASPHANCIFSTADYLHDGKAGASEFNSYLSDPAFNNATVFKPEILRYMSPTKVEVRVSYQRTDGIVSSFTTIAEFNGSKWAFRGNQRQFWVSVSGAIGRREILNTANANTSRYETGFDLFVSSNPNITQVVVTGPGLPGYINSSTRGTGVTLKAKSGCDFLAIYRASDNTVPFCAGFYRVRSLKFDGTDYVAPTTDIRYRTPYLSDAEIKAIEPGSLYRFDITTTSATTITYWNRLISRPYTVAEMVNVPWIDLSTTSRTQLSSGFPTASASKVSMSWVTPTSAAPASQLQIFHSQGNDRQYVPFTATTRTVTCTGNSLCDVSGNYTANSLNAPNSTMYQITSRNRFGTSKFAQFVQ